MEASVKAQTAHRNGDKALKYLAFYLGNEEFGIDVMKVREIIGVQDITVVPYAPATVKGVINLRGKVIPVLDLRLKLGLDEVAPAASTCIIVIELKRGSTVTGVIVDGVSEVLTVVASDIEAPPEFGSEVAIHFVSGLAKMKNGIKILLDIESILGTVANENKGAGFSADRGVLL
jgi:purine-binding chemotaxis protein CheW